MGELEEGEKLTPDSRIVGRFFSFEPIFGCCCCLVCCASFFLIIGLSIYSIRGAKEMAGVLRTCCV